MIAALLYDALKNEVCLIFQMGNFQAKGEVWDQKVDEKAIYVILNEKDSTKPESILRNINS